MHWYGSIIVYVNWKVNNNCELKMNQLKQISDWASRLQKMKD